MADLRELVAEMESALASINVKFIHGRYNPGVAVH